jgi:hypothetical protein
VPETYRHKFEALMGKVEDALQPLSDGLGADDIKRSARVLWAGVHVITSLSTAEKLSVVTTETDNRLIDDLVGTYLEGLVRRRDRDGGQAAAPKIRA